MVAPPLRDASTNAPKPLAYWVGNMHPDDRDNVIEAPEDATAGLRPYDTEFRVVWQNGSIHDLRATGRVTRDEQGTAVHMIGVDWDVTESRRLTAALAEQHDLLRVTLQSIADGVITTDIHRNVSWLNPVANFIAQGNTVGLARQTLLVSRGGAEYGIENQAAPIRNSNGGLIGNILVFRDVTEQRRLAAETEQVTRLQLELKNQG